MARGPRNCVVTSYLPVDLLDDIEREATRRKVPRTEVIRDALAEAAKRWKLDPVPEHPPAPADDKTTPKR